MATFTTWYKKIVPRKRTPWIIPFGILVLICTRLLWRELQAPSQAFPFPNLIRPTTLNPRIETEAVASLTIPPNNRPTLCDHTILKRRSFPTLRNCTALTTRLCEEGTFNLTALVSYPGSGNTWLRHLIEGSTGFFTGSVYFDESLFARGFIGEREEWSSGSTVVQKLHLKYSPSLPFQKAILLIREPIASVKSFVNYMESGHTGWASPITYSKKEWPLFLLRSTNDWAALARSWMESPVDLIIVHYENLVVSPINELRKILHFLNLNDSRLGDDCFLKSMEGSFHRRAPVWKIQPRIPNDIQLLINETVGSLNSWLNKHKHETPLEKYGEY